MSRRMSRRKYEWKYEMIYIETEKELLLPELPESWQLYREKSAGQVCFRLFEREI